MHKYLLQYLLHNISSIEEELRLCWLCTLIKKSIIICESRRILCRNSPVSRLRGE